LTPDWILAGVSVLFAAVYIGWLIRERIESRLCMHCGKWSRVPSIFYGRVGTSGTRWVHHECVTHFVRRAEDLSFEVTEYNLSRLDRSPGSWGSE
jgi:hypothetical protein